MEGKSSFSHLSISPPPLQECSSVRCVDIPGAHRCVQMLEAFTDLMANWGVGENKRKERKGYMKRYRNRKAKRET